MHILLLCVALLLVAPLSASAEDGTTFRRTTPRAPLHVAADEIVFGIPGGRAWGLESGLIHIGSHATVTLDLGVRDDGIREAFVRIAWYDRDAGRPRQILIEDAPVILPGIERRVALQLEAPEGAVAFRIRVLGRVIAGRPASRADAVSVDRVRVDLAIRLRPSLTRLRAGPP